MTISGGDWQRPALRRLLGTNEAACPSAPLRHSSSRALDQLCINTLRFLAVDAVEQAKSGHPGLPLGAAPMAYVSVDRVPALQPERPALANRDRFILSAGHGSALLYALLHLTATICRSTSSSSFRQWGSRHPGHPEYGHTPGRRGHHRPARAGLRHGRGHGDGRALPGRAVQPPGLTVVDHYTYAIVSDGDLMEGISSEAASLAGTLKLGKLIYLYDDNDISIEGRTDLAFTEDVGARFEAYGWQVQHVSDGNDLDAIEPRPSRLRRPTTSAPR